MKTLRLAAILAALLFSSIVSNATHFKGGDAYFQCVGGGYYKLIFNCYYSCEAGSSLPYAPSSMSFSIGGSCALPISMTCTHATTPVTVPDYCPGVLTSCDYYASGPIPAGTPDGTLLVKYSTDSFRIPAGCTAYASMDNGSRNAAITNLMNPAAYDMYLPAMITVPTGGTCGFDPGFVSIPATVAAVGRATNISYQVLSPGVDSLVYTLVSAKTTGNLAIPYVTGCDSLNPMGIGSGNPFASSFSLDRYTGDVRLVPIASGNYVITVGVTAYRNGVKIGSMLRDHQLHVAISAINNNPPVLLHKFSGATVSGGVIVDSNTITMCPGSTFQINLSATDADSNNFLYDSIDASGRLAGSVTSVSHMGSIFDTATIHISWTPQAADTGYHVFSLVVRDSACPQPGISRYNFVIKVGDQLSAGADQVHCAGGQPNVIHATGGGQYHWTNITGTAPIGVVGYSPDSSSITVSPSASATYVVTSNLSGQCRNSDTMTVTTAALYTLSTHALDTVICKNSTTTLNTVASPPGVGPFTYIWTPAVASVHNASTVSLPIASTTWYHVNVLSAGGCAVSDSVHVRVSGAPPHILLSTSANDVCQGDTVNLNAQVAYENIASNGTIDTCPSVTTLITARCYNSGDTLNTNGTGGPFNASYISQRVQYLFHPSELYAAGMTSGAITDISFFVSAVHSSAPYDGFYVSIGSTSEDSLSGFASGLYDMATYSSYSPHVGWNALPFAHYYTWDGSSNVVVQICYTNSFSGSSDVVAYSSTTSPGSTYYIDAFTGVGCTLQGNGASANTKPAVRFGMCTEYISPHYQWTPQTSLSDTLLSKSAVINSSITYHFTTTSPDGCIGADSIQVNLHPYLLAQSSSQLTICPGDTAHLSAFNNSFTPVCIQDYSVTSIPYAALTGTVTNIPNGSFVSSIGSPNTDEGTSGPINLPFSFPFYCGSFDQIWVNTNGWMSFANPYPATSGAQQYIAQTFPPAASDLNPQKMIALMVGDYALNSAGGNLGYFTTSSAPTRTFVIKVNALPRLGSPGVTTSGEIQLHEADGSIDILLASSNYAGVAHTTGIKNTTGMGLAAPGRNNAQYSISIPEAWHFAPRTETPVVQSILWTPNSFLNNDTLRNPVAYPSSTTPYVMNASVILHPVTGSAVCHVRDTVTVKVDHFNHTLTAGRLYVCAGDTTQLHFNTTNSLDSIIWSPASGLSSAYSASPVDTVHNTIMYTVNAKDAAGCRVKDSIRITSGTLNVWPGDANDDYTVDNSDILYIGIAFGETGPVRPNASLVWVAQCAQPWDSAFSNGVNYAHADGNGDGVAGYDDTLAVYNNWGLTHTKTASGRSSNLNITITTDKGLYDVNDTIIATISAGDASNLLTAVYGIAYKFEYTSHGVAHILSADQSMSWIDRKLDFRKVEAPLTAYLAQSRIDHKDTAGYGKIGEIRLKVDGGISLVDSGYLNVTTLLALNKNGDTVYLNPAAKAVAINGTVGIEAIKADQTIDIYPNPNNGVFCISQSRAAKINMIVVDAIGREVYAKALSERVTNVDLSVLPEGIYMVSFSGVSGKTTRRVIITK